MLRTPDRIVTRAEAQARKMTWFFTGKPCKRGHISTRNLNSHVCHACKRMKRSDELSQPILTDREKSAIFHEKWLAERKAFRAMRQAQRRRKLILDLLS